MYFLIERQKRLREALAVEAPAPFSPISSWKRTASSPISISTTPSSSSTSAITRRSPRTFPLPIWSSISGQAEVLRARIAKKASRDESHIAPEYIEELARAYEHFFFRYAASDLLVINTSDIRLRRAQRRPQLLLRRLQEPVKGTQYFLPLGANNRFLILDKRR